MTAFALVHGAWFHASVWATVADLLEARGHQVAALEVPSDDVEADAAAYVRSIADAIDPDQPVVVVGHTTAGLVLPLLPAVRHVERLVYVNALLPEIGKSLLDQTRENVVGRRNDEGRRYDRDARSVWDDRDAAHRLLAVDCPAERFDELFAEMRPQSRLLIREATPLTEWPDVPSSAIVFTDDADLSVDWLRDSARERLGTEPLELPGSQYGFVANPETFVDALIHIAND